MEYMKNIISGIILILVAIFYYINSLSIRIFIGMGDSLFNSGTMPRIWGISLAVLGLIILLRGLREWRISEKREKESKPQGNIPASLRNNYALIGTFLALAIYILFLDIAGFIIMTSIYLFIQINILTPVGKKRYLLSIIIAILFSIGIYAMFTKGFDMTLPAGFMA